MWKRFICSNFCSGAYDKRTAPNAKRIVCLLADGWQDLPDEKLHQECSGKETCPATYLPRGYPSGPIPEIFKLVIPKSPFQKAIGKGLSTRKRIPSLSCATRADRRRPSVWAAHLPDLRSLPDAILFQSHEQQDAYRVVPRLEPTLFLTDECLPRTDARPFVGHLQPRSLVPDLRRADPTGQSAG